MKNLSMFVVLALCLFGCNGSGANNAPSENAPITKVPDANTAASTSPGTAAGGNGGGVAPMAGGAGGMTPMSGTDSVTGASGGGVEQAAKKMAKDKAANMGSGSLNQGEKDDSGQ